MISTHWTTPTTPSPSLAAGVFHGYPVGWFVGATHWDQEIVGRFVGESFTRVTIFYAAWWKPRRVLRFTREVSPKGGDWRTNSRECMRLLRALAEWFALDDV